MKTENQQTEPSNRAVTDDMDVIDNEAVLQQDLGISTAPPDSPAGPAQPAEADFQVYIPASEDRDDATNQHFLVLPLPHGEFFAVWTQGCLEGASNQHLVTARSSDGGITWSDPAYFDGPREDGHIASWAFPFLMPHTGRLYVFYNKNCGFVDFHHQWTGQLWFRFSDDFGYTWSHPYKHLRLAPDSYSHPDPQADPNWITYQPPIITTQGEVLAGFTQVATKKLARDGVFPSQVRFMRFDNILTEENPEKLHLTTLPQNQGDGLRLQDPANPWSSTLEEPALQCLSDGLIFCVMRTATGYIGYSVSADGGRSWSAPDILRYAAGGHRIRHPIIPCPLYKLRDGRFILIFHNNRGDANQGRHVADWCRNRRPVYLTVGREVLHNPEQPLMFRQPSLLADNDRVPISRKQLTEIGTYPSLFEYGGKVYFFFPDRKHYLLGKVLPESLLSDYGLSL